ncbi:MAG TPA: divergent polysaccharide deacetylase family protein [Gammaproteobacteria bacterium]|nr:divergent polysaccharide deacetylase family protein [Gammaproteobacteria bacterium]
MRGLTLLLVCAAWVGGVIADPATPPGPVVAVMIDDLGYNLDEGRRVAALPGPVACAILPHTAHATDIADLAHAAGKEVLLHLPMESVTDMPLGPGAVTLDMGETEIKQTVREDIASLPYLVGVNNHEGSLITQHPGDLAWIMQALHAAGPYFYIDSYTTADSVAYEIAREQGVAAARRNVFLDDENTEESVEQQWQRLLELARRHGFALAIGHPKSATLAMLEAELPKLAAAGVTIVPVSRIVALQEAHPLPWPESSSPSPTAAKR